MPKKHRLIVIDRHPIFREGIRTVAAKDRAFDMVGDAGTAAEGLRLVRRFKPDLILVDLFPTDMDSAEAVAKLQRTAPASRILMVGDRAAIAPIVAAVEAGASGFIAKTAGADRLLAALKAVLKGDTFLDGTVSGAVVARMAKSRNTLTQTSDAGHTGLTRRETEILQLLAEGFAARDIAASLYISPKTVDNHRANIMRKLRLENAVGLVRYAAKVGLIDVRTWHA